MSSLNKALRMVEEKASEETEAGKFAAILLPILQAAAQEIRPRRGTGDRKYLVETTQQGEVLTERREKAKPYRCPKAVYEALSTVLAEAERPLLLDEIATAVGAKLGDQPAFHQVRVALRLWMHVQPPLVTRNRARYRANNAKGIEIAAKGLWDTLKVSSK